MFRTLSFLFLPLILIAQDQTYPDTLYLKSDKIYQCTIKKLHSDKLDILYGEKVLPTTIKIGNIQKISTMDLGIIYTAERGFTRDLDGLNSVLKERDMPADFIEAQMTIITLTDGSELVGFVLNDTPEEIQFRTKAGVEMTISRDKIEELQTIEGEWKDGEYRKFDPNRTRLFFSPTARPLKAGEGYFAVYEIFFPMVAVGITDFFAISGGISLLPYSEHQVIYLAPKATIINSDNFQLGGGLLYMTAAGESYSLVYAVTTFGSPSLAFTGGMGWGLVDGDFSDVPVITLGLEVQISNSAKLITENWILPDEGALISFGIRFFGSHLAGDFGLITSTEASGDGFPFVPWLGIAYNF